MKRELTQREKILLVILIVLALGAAYYLFFYVPTQEKMDQCRTAIAETEDALVLADAKVTRMKRMEAELAVILADGAENVKALPQYDNSGNVMRELYDILGQAGTYEISFTTVNIEESVARRNIDMSYACPDYAAAKNILSRISDSDYRCLLKDIVINEGGDSGCRVSVNITYFEYV